MIRHWPNNTGHGNDTIDLRERRDNWYFEDNVTKEFIPSSARTEYIFFENGFLIAPTIKKRTPVLTKQNNFDKLQICLSWIWINAKMNMNILAEFSRYPKKQYPCGIVLTLRIFLCIDSTSSQASGEQTDIDHSRGSKS